MLSEAPKNANIKWISCKPNENQQCGYVLLLFLATVFAQLIETSNCDQNSDVRLVFGLSLYWRPSFGLVQGLTKYCINATHIHPQVTHHLMTYSHIDWLKHSSNETTVQQRLIDTFQPRGKVNEIEHITAPNLSHSILCCKCRTMCQR